jgi:hypothetical protein
MKQIMTIFFALLVISGSIAQTLDFKFYDSNGKEFSSLTFNKETITKAGIDFDGGIILLETPSLDDSFYVKQNLILNLLDAESLRLIYIKACPKEEYKHGYHTTIETAKALINQDIGFRIRLLDNNSGVLFESFKVISKEIVNQVYSSDQKYLSAFLLEDELKPDNLLLQYKQFDFSGIFSHTENYQIFGVIGADNQRIKVKLTSIIRSPENAGEYLVSGKSNVRDVICDFNGTITITEINEVKQLHYGVDSEYANKGIKAQGILIANYEFKENPHQDHSGSFQGIVYSKWYLNAGNQIQYDDIQSFSDQYMNNAFIGIWKSYSAGNEKLCNWADHRIPLTNQDFDMGAGEFSPGEKYYDKGWKAYHQAWQLEDKESKAEELKEWWK